MTTEKGLQSKIIRDSFQTPNYFVDKCMGLLSGNEFMCLVFISRKTFGWQKPSDRIAKQQITQATGLADDTVDKCIATLIEFGLVLRLSENNTANTGVEWALRKKDTLVRFDLMQKRKEEQKKSNRKKTDAARKKLAQKKQGVGLSKDPPLEPPSVEQAAVGGGAVQQPNPPLVEQPQGGIVQQPPQKPLTKAKEKNMGAAAPARADRVEAFPADCRVGAQLMLEIFNVIPPERPPADARGGEFALWVKEIRALEKKASEYGVPLENAMRLAFKQWNNAPFNLSHPGALTKVMISVLAQSTPRSRNPIQTMKTALESQLETFKPRQEVLHD